MAGETDLDRLIAGMQPELDSRLYVFVTLTQGERPPPGLTWLMSFREDEGLTLIVPEAGARLAGLAGAYPCRRITLRVQSDLAAVGFLARVTARLAEAGISVNPVSAFHHDHLFVPVERAEEAMEVLMAVRAGG
jgi:hypothetical protein